VFYGESFGWYNMFNDHFLETVDDPEGAKSKNRFESFVKSSRSETLAVLLDPPFGGRVEPIADSLKKLVQTVRKSGSEADVFFFWVFPYFMEPYLRNELPGISMLDYRVDYADHKMFNQGKTPKNNTVG